MKPFLMGVVPKDILILPNDYNEKGMASCIDVFQEVRCVTRPLEEDRSVRTSCVLCILKNNYVKQQILWLPVRAHENRFFHF